MAAARTRTRARDLPDPNPERLVHTYANLILRLSYTYLKSTQDAEDICQDVLMKRLKRAEPFENLEHERAWIIRVTSNACKDLLRRADRKLEVVNLDDIPEPAAPQEHAPSFGPGRPSRVTAAVMSLPVAYREAIYLHYYEGYAIKEIARVTGKSESAIAQHLSRGRAKLRASLGDMMEGDFDEQRN